MTVAEVSTGFSLEDGPLKPGVRAGSYLIERRLGSGGMGAVYAATHIGLDKPVALKALHRTFAVQEKSVKRFVREGRAASRIRHPHVVDVTDVGSHDGIPFLVMEKLDGEDLEQYLDRCGSLEASRLVEIMLPVIDAVATAHDAGVIHRDLKPSNIFLARDGRGTEVPKVLDFGIARMLHEQGNDRIRLTQQGAFVGTPYYASPEQATNGSAADARSDQFSIGAILYQLASGKLPVEGKTPFEVLTAIVCGEITPFHTLRNTWHPGLVEVVERSMRFEADERYADLRELGRALITLASDDTHARFRVAFGAPPRSAAQDVGFVPTRAAMPAQQPGLVMPETRMSMPRVEEPTFSAPVGTAVPAKKRSWAPLMLGLLALLVTGGGAAAYWAAVRPVEPTVTAEPTAAAEPTEQPAEVPETPIASLQITPETATIEWDGEPVGTGTTTLALDGETHTLRISAPGFETLEREITAGQEMPATLTLVAAPEVDTAEEGTDVDATAEVADGTTEEAPTIENRPPRPTGRRRVRGSGRLQPQRNPVIRPTRTPIQHTAPRVRPPVQRPPPVGANGAPVLH
ncbi:MAG: serine/threonine-protein kinase [Sandaracinaceae bacterium]